VDEAIALVLSKEILEIYLFFDRIKEVVGDHPRSLLEVGKFDILLRTCR